MPRLSTFARKTGLPRQRRWADVYAQVRALREPTPDPKPAAPAIIKVAPEIEQVARYMVREFHDWALNGKYWLEPGFQRLVGQSTRVIRVHYKGLRDDWEDDCRRALDAWAELGFDFVETEDPQTAEITVDDEVKGAYAQRGFRYMGRQHNGLPVIRAATREVNIWKEWPDWDLYDAMLHEIGHVLGLGHPGPYNGERPAQPYLPADNSRNTIMSYYGSNVGKLGPADRLAIELIYNS